MIKKENLDPDSFKIVFVIKESASYYGFHKEISDELLGRFKKALDKLKTEGVVEHLLNKYLD